MHCDPIALHPLLLRLRGFELLLDGGLESLGVGADNLTDLLLVLEEDESGNGLDVQLLGDLGNLIDGVRGVTDLATCGAMTLQGPHQVAKQSRTMRESFSSRAVSNDFLSARAWTPSVLMIAVDRKVRA
jgi:hypothetical protein